MMFKLACMAAVVIRNPPPWIKRKRPKVQACPTIRLFWLSRSSAPGPCKCPEREKVARHRDRQQTAARRSPVDTVVENPAAQLSHTSPSPTTPSPSHVQPTPRHISCPLLPLSRVPHQSYPTTRRPSPTLGIATADRRPQTFASNSRGVNKEVTHAPTATSLLTPPSTSHEGASLACPTHLLPFPDSHSPSGMH